MRFGLGASPANHYFLFLLLFAFGGGELNRPHAARNSPGLEGFLLRKFIRDGSKLSATICFWQPNRPQPSKTANVLQPKPKKGVVIWVCLKFKQGITQVLVHVSTYQGSVLGTGFLSHSHSIPPDLSTSRRRRGHRRALRGLVSGAEPGPDEAGIGGVGYLGPPVVPFYRFFFGGGLPY